MNLRPCFRFFRSIQSQFCSETHVCTAIVWLLGCWVGLRQKKVTVDQDDQDDWPKNTWCDWTKINTFTFNIYNRTIRNPPRFPWFWGFHSLSYLLQETCIVGAELSNLKKCTSTQIFRRIFSKFQGNPWRINRRTVLPTFAININHPCI